MGVSDPKWFTSNSCSSTVGAWEADRMVIHSGRTPRGIHITTSPSVRVSVVGHNLPIGAELGESACLK